MSKGVWQLPDWIDSEKWAEFEDHRRESGHKLTDPGRRRIVAKLEAMRKRGFDFHAALDMAMERGWRSVFESPDLPRFSQPHPEDANRLVEFGRRESKDALKQVAQRGINPRFTRTP